ncbi:flagellar hook-basal body complex protein FliE [Pseudaeromonas paramecii]|uniref:Flagellar hook-basal body complex protein FliE n=1 Tax=Pseudaeromonas paramecii TaxID=2138166 RepID=A0ABP8Q5P3_9GAMM
MNVPGSSLFTELEAMRVEARGLPTQAVRNDLGVNDVHSSFGKMLQDALGNVNELQQTTNDLRTRFDMGDRSISLSDVMIAGQKSSIAFEATVQVRNKVLEAYKTIMNMPV